MFSTRSGDVSAVNKIKSEPVFTPVQIRFESKDGRESQILSLIARSSRRDLRMSAINSQTLLISPRQQIRSPDYSTILPFSDPHLLLMPDFDR